MSKADPPPPRAQVRLAEHWELCSTASTNVASIAAAVRRGGGGTAAPARYGAALILARSITTVDTWTLCPLCSRDIRKPVATADMCVAAASAGERHAYNPAKRNRAPAALGTPTPLSAVKPSTSPSAVSPAALRCTASRSKTFTLAVRRCLSRRRASHSVSVARWSSFALSSCPPPPPGRHRCAPLQGPACRHPNGAGGT